MRRGTVTRRGARRRRQDGARPRHLQVVDNQVDQTTGTMRMKAEFPNANLQLWPGQFVNVRVLIDTLEQVVVVPTPAVQRGPNGTFAYVVQADDKRGAAARHGRPCRTRPRPSSPRASTPPSASSPPASPASRTARASSVAAPARSSSRAAEAERRRQPRPSRRRARSMRAACAADIAEVLPRRRARRASAAACRQTPRKLSEACKAAAGAAAAASRARPTRARRTAARRNERLLALHPAADRHLAAGLRRDARRRARLLAGCRSRRCRRSISRPSRSRPSCRAPTPRRRPTWSRRRSSASSGRSRRSPP